MVPANAVPSKRAFQRAMSTARTRRVHAATRCSELYMKPWSLQAGDFCQIWDFSGMDIIFGHSIVITGQGKRKGRGVLECWSSDNIKSVGNMGHGHDFFYHKHPNALFDREFYIARLFDFLIS